MIHRLLYHLTFLGLAGALMLVLCVDLGLPPLGCQRGRLIAAGGRKAIQVAVPKAASTPRPKAVAKPAPTPAEKKRARELEKAKLRIKHLEARMAQLKTTSDALLKSVAAQLENERKARATAEQQREAERQRQTQDVQQRLAAQQAESRRAAEAAEARHQQSLKAMERSLAARAEAARAEDRKATTAAHAEQMAAIQRQLQAARQARAAERQQLTAAAEQARQQAERDRAELGRRQAVEAQAARRREAERQALAARQARQDQAARAQAAEVSALRARVEQQDRALAAERAARRRVEADRQAARREAEARRAAEQAALKRRVDAQARTITAQQRRLRDLAARPAPAAGPRAAARPKGPIARWEDYLQFLSPVRSIQLDRDGRELPVLDFNGGSFATHLQAIMSFYQMGFFGLLVYRERNEKDPNYLRIDLSGGIERPRFEQSSDPAHIDRLASIGLLWNTSRIGRQLMQRIQAERPIRVPDGAYLALVNLFPTSTAQYFIWKRIEVCRRNGVDPATVNRCLATFRQTRFGSWIVVIDSLELKDGRRVAVRDFEAERVALR